MTEGQNDRQAENSIRPQTTFCGGITKIKGWHHFLEANWQLTLHSVVRADQNSYSSML